MHLKSMKKSKDHNWWSGRFFGQLVEILVFASPTSYLLTSFSFPLLKIGVYSINSSKMIGDFPADLNYFNRFISK